MKIAYLIREGIEGIVSPCYYELVKELEKKGNELIVLNETGSFGDFECIRVNPKKVIDYPSGAFNKILYSRAAKKKLKELKPDLVFGSLPESVYFLHDLDIPKAVMVQDDLKNRINFTPLFSEFKVKYGFIPLPEYTKLGVKIDYFFQLRSLNKSDGVVFVNKEAEKEFKKKPSNLTRVIPNGVNPKDFVLDSKTKREVKKIKDSFPEPIFLFMGRLELQKNPLLFVRAAERVLKKNNAFFLITGNGVMYKRIKEEIIKLNLTERVKLLGWKDGLEKKALLHACHAFVLPSLFDPMPVSLIEAMSCSKPSIVSSVGGMKETIDGETGIKVEPNNLDQLANAMNSLLSNPKKALHMGKNAKRRIQKFYDWEKIAENYNDFFNELIEWKAKK
ncbi:MAG: glycosyltransferase family 4 protein [archaeon]